MSDLGPVVKALTARVEWLLRRDEWNKAQFRRLQQAMRETDQALGGPGLARLEACVLRVTTGPVGAVTAPAYATLSGVLQLDSGSSPYADHPDATVLVAKYDWDKTLANGAYVACLPIGGSLWVVDVKKCGSLS